MEDPNIKVQVLINKFNRKTLTSFSEFKTNYELYYASYLPDTTSLKDLGKSLKNIKVTIILGTWCSDSQLQVANFLKIIDSIKLKEENIIFIGVDESKHAENGIIDDLKITNVPTFIFCDKDGEEIARITEKPLETLEKDMLNILEVK